MDEITLWDRLADAQWHEREATNWGDMHSASLWRRQIRRIERLIERNHA